MKRRPVAGGRRFARCAVVVAVGSLVHLAVDPGSLRAQTVLGTAVEAADGRPIRGAFVLLENEEGEERARGLTTVDGAFRLATARPGTYRLRLERIGFEDLVTEPFQLEAGERISRHLEVNVSPVELSAVKVEGGEPRCGTPADEALELGRVWDEARKALEGAAWTDRQSYYRFDVLLFRQELDPDGAPVAEPEYESIRVYGRHPFVSALPNDLAYGGWVRRQGEGLKFYAPDAEVLLSDSFLGLHCFRLVRSEPAADRRLGIEFAPVPGRRVGRAIPDIRGVLWLDPETAELRTLEFGYANLDLPVPTDLLGGRVEFDHLPDGSWIVRSWEIRTPLAELRDLRQGGRREQRVRLAGLQLEGRQVLAVWRTGDVQADPNAEVPADLPPVVAPPDELIRRYATPPEHPARIE